MVAAITIVKDKATEADIHLNTLRIVEVFHHNKVIWIIEVAILTIHAADTNKHLMGSLLKPEGIMEVNSSRQIKDRTRRHIIEDHRLWGIESNTMVLTFLHQENLHIPTRGTTHHMEAIISMHPLRKVPKVTFPKMGIVMFQSLLALCPHHSTTRAQNTTMVTIMAPLEG